MTNLILILCVLGIWILIGLIGSIIFSKIGLKSDSGDIIIVIILGLFFLIFMFMLFGNNV